MVARFVARLCRFRAILMMGLFMSNIPIKFAVTFVSIPGNYLVKEQSKK